VRRRRFLLAPLALLAPRAPRAGAAEDYPPVVPGHALEFPRDHGAHPAFRTEWWYVTGWLGGEGGRTLGFQVTFFRSRPRIAEANPSAFAPRQLVFAHAALADPRERRLVHDQRAARAGFGLADARAGDTDAWVEDWSLRRGPEGYAARIPARDFALELAFGPTQPILPHGEQGYSRKGPLPAQSSYYYSRPHLAVSGTVARGARREPVTGSAWLDHEWSSEYMAAGAVGWDWIGVNLADGGALMAFRMRGRDGGTFWTGGTLRTADSRVRTFAPEEVRFAPQRRWKSPRTETEYPVAMHVRVGELAVAIEPLFDDQELDSRASTGTIYWEGAVRARAGERAIGTGYLELTGYWRPLKL
jgi:predicted secreted hydrolase